MNKSDAEFLVWVADWLDRIDPILRAVFSKAEALTEDERQRMDEWLAGTEVQERLRSIADGSVTEDLSSIESDPMAAQRRGL